MMKKELSGWGNYPRITCDVCGPETIEAVGPLFDRGSLIARGLGRSYGDPAISSNGLVVDMTRCDRLIAFDEERGLLRCEAGASLEQILDVFVPRGFLPLITPGTKFVTIGGCIANDVHGKAHHVDGSFVNSVESMTIMLADKTVVTASRGENSDLFWASFGGMGLLGIILDATIRLRPVQTAYFKQKAIVVKCLDELVEAFERYDTEYPYSVSWIDPLATGGKLGQGVLTVGDHAACDDLPARLRDNPLRVSQRSPITVPVNLPNFALNSATLRMLNVVLGQVQSRAGSIAHYEKFFYPLDAVGEWNRGYGKRGFTQYQFVVPTADVQRRMRPILERIAKSGQLPFLNVLKKLGKGIGMLSFPMDGYTFAIDFPINAKLNELFSELDRMVIDAGGRIYLGKDAFLNAQSLRAMYGELDKWREIKAKVDPHNRFCSAQSQRVGLTP